jgi:predicted RNA-binding Zn-ribbon protein involved in translation (DUF1610 family)
MNETANFLFVVVSLLVIILFLYFRLKGRKALGKECPACGETMERVYPVEEVIEKTKDPFEQYELLRQYKCPKCGWLKALEKSDILKEFTRFKA